MACVLHLVACWQLFAQTKWSDFVGVVVVVMQSSLASEHALLFAVTVRLTAGHSCCRLWGEGWVILLVDLCFVPAVHANPTLQGC